MPESNQGIGDQPPSELSAQPPVATSQLVTLYDELAEIVALNNFIYDSFQSFTSDPGNNFSVNTTSGVGLTCKWLCQRQVSLKEEFYRLIQLSKATTDKE